MDDPADNASKREEMDRTLALDAMKNRYQEKPEFDEDGKRRCIDCWGFIPKKRIESINAVRCVGCQQEQEINDRNYK